ncbi:hypothetical protein Q8A67_019736 [Cirrhinus molitorella]|uniref:Uncharacterized protein n=1 Tax=Cirrhinus molitorella TaxID=172907 RepID=A0AA88PF13_9TELE|nr:hypothetical protein Q8A67_019736 [Cirrhinus molitorella]
MDGEGTTRPLIALFPAFVVAWSSDPNDSKHQELVRPYDFGDVENGEGVTEFAKFWMDKSKAAAGNKAEPCTQQHL